jgi:hypothetical protein
MQYGLGFTDFVRTPSGDIPSPEGVNVWANHDSPLLLPGEAHDDSPILPIAATRFLKHNWWWLLLLAVIVGSRK